MGYHAAGHQAASSDRSVFPEKISQVPEGIALGESDSLSPEAAPGGAERGWLTQSFGTAARDLRQREQQRGIGRDSLVLDPEVRFFCSLEDEPATRRIERACGVRGEGPSISFNSTSLRALMLDNPTKAFALLDRYYPVYCSSFPDPDERLPFDTIVRLVQDPRFSIDVDIFTGFRGVIGGYQTNVTEIEGQTYSLGDYLFIDNQMKGLGVGPLVYRTTIEQRRKIFGASAHFGEINDPKLMNAAQQAIDKKSGTDPDARLKFWSKQGRRMLDVPWVQPAPDEGLSPVDYTMLTVHQLDGARPLSLTGETVMRIWDAYYLPLKEIAPILETRQEMRRLLEPYRGRQIELKNLTDNRSFIERGSYF